jgi:hypothetical protein
MTMDRERFAKGMTYEEAKANLPKNLPNMEQNEKELQLSEDDLAPWRALPEKVNAMVLVIDPCPDVYTNLPILARIAEKTGKVDIRVFMRDDNKDLMAEFMNGPYESVPVIAFYDQDFTLQGVFIERPKTVTEHRAQLTAKIHESDPAFGPVGTAASQMAEDVRQRYQAGINQMRGDTKQFYFRESIGELAEIARELAGKPAGAKWHGNLVAVPA